MRFHQELMYNTKFGTISIILISICMISACKDSPNQTSIVGEFPDSIVSTIDGRQMRLIPSGRFEMGNSKTAIGDDDELPVHSVSLDAFYMDIYEVTNAHYQKFVIATGYSPPPLWHDSKFNQPDAPVVNVSWNDAVTYAHWAKKRLPTEAEWEYAARGGLIGKIYANSNIITHDDANFGGVEGKDIWIWTSPVGSFTPNGYGLYDMIGNVWEWCFDEYNAGFYEFSTEYNPKFGRSIAPENENFRILRGGAWGGSKDDLRVSDRWYHLSSGSTIGFRCVMDIDTVN